MSFDDWDLNEDGKEDFEDYQYYADMYCDDDDEESDDDTSYNYKDDNYVGSYVRPDTYGGMTLEELRAENDRIEKQNEEIRRSNRRFFINGTVVVVLVSLFLIFCDLDLLGGLLLMIWIMYVLTHICHKNPELILFFLRKLTEKTFTTCTLISESLVPCGLSAFLLETVCLVLTTYWTGTAVLV